MYASVYLSLEFDIQNQWLSSHPPIEKTGELIPERQQRTANRSIQYVFEK